MFDIRNDDKTLVLIDGANIYATAKALGFDIDYKLFIKQAEQCCNLLRIQYYTALVEENDHIMLKPLVDWLSYNGYTVVSKPAKIIMNNDGRRIKGNMDIELAVGAIEMAISNRSGVGNIVLCTGDGDFCALTRYLQRIGIHVTVLSSTKTTPPMCADDLRKQADKFIELAELQDLVGKPYRQTDVIVREPEEVEDINPHVD